MTYYCGCLPAGFLTSVSFPNVFSFLLQHNSIPAAVSLPEDFSFTPLLRRSFYGNAGNMMFEFGGLKGI